MASNKLIRTEQIVRDYALVALSAIPSIGQLPDHAAIQIRNAVEEAYRTGIGHGASMERSREKKLKKKRMEKVK